VIVQTNTTLFKKEYEKDFGTEILYKKFLKFIQSKFEIDD